MVEWVVWAKRSKVHNVLPGASEREFNGAVM